MSWQDLKDAFSQYNATYADIKMSADGRSRGWGIVRFATVAEAQAAIAGVNGQDIGGRPAIVRDDNAPAPGGEAAAAY